MSDQKKIDLEDFGELFNQVLETIDQATGISDPADLTLPTNPVTTGSRVVSASDWVDAMMSGVANAGDRWLRRTLSPRRNPITAAIAADQKRRDRLAEADRQNRYVRGMERVDVDAMYETVEAAGPSAYTSGVERRRRKIEGRVAKLQPLVQGLAQTIDTMKQDTDAQREARMIAARRGMIAIGKRLRGITE